MGTVPNICIYFSHVIIKNFLAKVIGVNNCSHTRDSHDQATMSTISIRRVIFHVKSRRGIDRLTGTSGQRPGLLYLFLACINEETSRFS